MDTKAIRARCDAWPYDIGQAKEDVTACLDHIEAQNKRIEVLEKALEHSRQRLMDIDGQAHCIKRGVIFERASHVGVFARSPGDGETFGMYWDDVEPVDPARIRALSADKGSQT